MVFQNHDGMAGYLQDQQPRRPRCDGGSSGSMPAVPSPDTVADMVAENHCRAVGGGAPTRMPQSAGAMLIPIRADCDSLSVT